MKINIEDFTAKIAEQFLEEDQPKVTKDIEFKLLNTFDSLTGMAMLGIIKEEYKVDIPVNEFRKMTTINELYDYINNVK